MTTPSENKKKTIAIIRSCERDDMKAKLCYETMKYYNVADKYVFFQEQSNHIKHPYVSSCGQEIFYRDFYDNFCGENAVHGMVGWLQKYGKINEDEYEWVIFCDADIIMHDSPHNVLSEGAEYAGYFNEQVFNITQETGEREAVIHVSGQFNMLKSYLWNEYIFQPQQQLQKFIQLTTPFSTYDDTVLSVWLHWKKPKMYTFAERSCFRHHKADEAEYNELADKYGFNK